MATERLKTVKPTGGDYTSLAAAIAGEAGNLVAADEWLHVECYAMTDTAEANITGFTTDADCKIVVDTPLSERHQGVWDSNKYNITGPIDNGIIKVNQAHVLLEGLQAYSTLAWSGAAIYLYDYFLNNHVSKCIVRANTNRALRVVSAPGLGYKISNCIAIDSPVGFDVRSMDIYNCTAVNCTVGFRRSYGPMNAYNCLAANNTTGFDQVGGNTWTLYNCASSDGTADDFAGSGNRVNQTFSFKDAANGDYHLAENDTGARGHGLTDPGSGLYLDDIDGEIRTVPWDIGADQFVSGGGDKVPIGAINRYYRTLMGGQAR
jgi:hypothetical protein